MVITPISLKHGGKQNTKYTLLSTTGPDEEYLWSSGST